MLPPLSALTVCPELILTPRLVTGPYPRAGALEDPVAARCPAQGLERTWHHRGSGAQSSQRAGGDCWEPGGEEAQHRAPALLAARVQFSHIPLRDKVGAAGSGRSSAGARISSAALRNHREAAPK